MSIKLLVPLIKMYKMANQNVGSLPSNNSKMYWTKNSVSKNTFLYLWFRVRPIIGIIGISIGISAFLETLVSVSYIKNCIGNDKWPKNRSTCSGIWVWCLCLWMKLYIIRLPFLNNISRFLGWLQYWYQYQAKNQIYTHTAQTCILITWPGIGRALSDVIIHIPPTLLM